MSGLDRALVAVVTSGASWVVPHVEALRAAGARVRVCMSDGSLWSILCALDYDAILIGDVDGGAGALSRALAEDARLRTIPALVLLAPGESGTGGVELPVLDGPEPNDTVATVAALVDVHVSRRGASLPPRASVPPATESPARRELESGFHDLRVLLGIVVGYGSNLRDGADGPLTPTQREHVLKLLEAASDAAALLDQTMVAVRAAAVGVPAPRTRGTSRALVDVAALAESVARMFGKAAVQREIDLVSATTGPVEVWGNALQLKQVIANLVVNALKFAPAGGRVRISTRIAPSGLAEIAVSDNGPGVPMEDRERIFEHGVRLERDRNVGGTGIGLATVRDLVIQQHGGSVRVGDAPGGGAQFVVLLPLDHRVRLRDAVATPSATTTAPAAEPPR
jgi:two-component sensor histidine kinase